MRAVKKKIILPGTTVGLLGGSFNPPHIGHVHITEQALKAFRLQNIWWLVSPGNPLKEKYPGSVDSRINQCRKIMQNPKVFISDIERQLDTRFTAETLRKLFRLYPGVRFIWLMGADNLSNFHKWDEWTWIMENIPVGVMARPRRLLRAGLSRTAYRYMKYRVKQTSAAAVPFMEPPAWSLLGGSMQDVSSTKLRLYGRK